jgi:hypothetical protein
MQMNACLFIAATCPVIPNELERRPAPVCKNRASHDSGPQAADAHYFALVV